MTTNGKGVIAQINALEPLLARGSIVSAFGILGMVLNHHFADGTVQYVCNIILAAFGLVTAIVSRRTVTPNSKVITYTPDPVKRPNLVEDGNSKDF